MPRLPQEQTVSSMVFVGIDIASLFGHTPLQLLTTINSGKLTVSNESHGHIIGRPIYQQYETGPYANPLLSWASIWTSLNIPNIWSQSSGNVARADQRGQGTTAG